MQEERFNQIIEAQVDMALALFRKKNDAYSGTQIVDRLAGVKDVAAIRGVSKLEAISGMMAKHTMSIYNMMKSDQEFPIEVWNEKISDHINYLLLAAASLHEDHDELSDANLARGEDPDRNFNVDTYVDPSDGQPDDLNAIRLAESKQAHPSNFDRNTIKVTVHGPQVEFGPGVTLNQFIKNSKETRNAR